MKKNQYKDRQSKTTQDIKAMPKGSKAVETINKLPAEELAKAIKSALAKEREK